MNLKLTFRLAAARKSSRLDQCESLARLGRSLVSHLGGPGPGLIPDLVFKLKFDLIQVSESECEYIIARGERDLKLKVT